MNTHNSNSDETTYNSGKSINNLKDEVVNGEGIIGGDKTVIPITIIPNVNDLPIDVSIPGVILPANDAADYAVDANPMIMTDGSINLQ